MATREGTVDHCTLWLEGNWAYCCARHDLDYADALVDRIVADEALASCVAGIGGFAIAIAGVMYLGVRIFGGRFRRAAAEKMVMTALEIQLNAIAGGRATPGRTANIRSIIRGLDTYGQQAGLDQPQRLAHYVTQLAHESGRFVHDREVWGPTAAQKGYEGRKDLGNTEPGDGSKFRGYTPGQITGRFNTTAFRDWCRGRGLPAPDFVKTPALMNSEPWEGLGPIWYWDTRNLNRYADENNIEMVTKRINGGLNGYADRLELYTRTALVFLGHSMTEGVLERFQESAGLIADDIPGPKTRAALHAALGRLEAGGTAPAPAPQELEELETTPQIPPVTPETPPSAKVEEAFTLAQYAEIAQASIQAILDIEKKRNA